MKIHLKTKTKKYCNVPMEYRKCWKKYFSNKNIANIKRFNILETRPTFADFFMYGFHSPNHKIAREFELEPDFNSHPKGTYLNKLLATIGYHW